MSREVIFMGRPYKCPYCGQSESVSKGVRRTKTMGERRIRRCKACKRKFTPKNQKLDEAGDAVAQPGPARTSQVAAEVPAATAGEPQGPGVEVTKPDGPVA